MNLKNRHFLTLKDYSKEEIRYLLDLAHQLKADKKAGKIGQHLLGKNVCLIFEKTSTRTRCSFEVAALDEGGHATFLSNSQMGKKESIEDTAKVLGRMYDGIEFRGFKQETVEALARYSGVPVWNGLTDVDHPTQTLADFLTIEEHLDKPLEDIKFVFTGDIRNNVCYGLMYGAVKMGMHFVCLGPKSLHIDPEVLAYCKEEAKKSGGTIEVTDNVDEAVKDADIICTVTPSKEPLLTKEMVKPGTHINAVGTFTPTTREVSSDLVAAARLYSDQTEAAKRESGEYLIPLKEGLIKEDHIVGSIGEVLLGKAPGRTADDEITIFDALGLAIEDVASAKYVYERVAL